MVDMESLPISFSNTNRPRHPHMYISFLLWVYEADANMFEVISVFFRLR